MYKYLFFAIQFIFGTILLWSCTDKGLDVSCVNIALNSSDTTKSSFDRYFDVTECLPLQGPVDCQISFARRVIFFENEYYVFSSNGNVGLFVFDKNGKFTRRIGNKGNGRGEYTNILDFTIDIKNRRIFIICNRSSLIKIYSLDGKYLEEKILHETSLSDIACVNGVILCPTNHQGFTKNENDSLFYIFDEKFNFVDKHTFVTDNNLGMASLIPSSIKAYGDKFVFSDFHEHRTFLLTAKGNIEKCFKYEEDDLIPLESQKNVKLFMGNQVKSSFVLSSSILNDKCITFFKSGKDTKLSINKFDGECVVNTSIRSFPYFLGYDGNQAISAISYETLKALNIKYKGKENDSLNYFIIKYRLLPEYDK